MTIILISPGFRGQNFRRKPPAYKGFRAFAGPTKDVGLGCPDIVPINGNLIAQALYKSILSLNDIVKIN